MGAAVPPAIGQDAAPPIAGPDETEATEPPATPPEPKTWPHKGFTAEVNLGLQGCVRTICKRHGGSPGFRFDASLGGNVFGFVELGFSGGWGTLGARVEPGSNALALYGVNTEALEDALYVLGQVFAFDLDSLLVENANIRTARGGPYVRVHFIPRGRFAAFVGSGVGYSLLRARYSLRSGDSMRIDFHGLDVPIEAGAAYFVHPNIAVGLQFRYLWSRYFAAFITHPLQRAAAPVSILDQAMTDGSSLREDLPQTWSLTATLRVRF